MEHYSIQATDIYISKIESVNGWHLGDVVHYEVNNCAWESRIELQLRAENQGHSELQAMQFFLHGDKNKMLNDQNITLLALQTHLNQHQQDMRLKQLRNSQ